MPRLFSHVCAAAFGVLMVFKAAAAPAQQVIHLNVLPPPGRYAVETPIYTVGKAGDPQRIERALAVSQLRRWDRLEYPAQMRRIESAISTTKDEIASFERRFHEYHQYNWSIGKATFYDEEVARVGLAHAKQRLRDLEEDRLLLIRTRPEERRQRELEASRSIGIGSSQ